MMKIDEATKEHWDEIHVLNELTDIQEWFANLSYLCSQNNPLAFRKLEIIAEQRREADDSKPDSIEPDGNIYRE